jgi:hypothetical protein
MRGSLRKSFRRPTSLFPSKNGEEEGGDEILVYCPHLNSTQNTVYFPLSVYVVYTIVVFSTIEKCPIAFSWIQWRGFPIVVFDNSNVIAWGRFISFGIFLYQLWTFKVPSESSTRATIVNYLKLTISTKEFNICEHIQMSSLYTAE